MKSKMLATIMMTPAGDEVAERQLPGGRDVDEDADERQDVRVDSQRDARADDRAQREHADPADEAGEGHEAAACGLRRMIAREYNERFRSVPPKRAV